MICVDANIIVRLIAPEPHLNVNRQWSEWQSTGSVLAAPTLLKYEVVNSFHRMRLQGKVADDLAAQMVETAMQLPLTFHDDSGLSVRAFALAAQFNLKATYDAHYLALSEHLGCDLWTTDKRFFNAVNPGYPQVRLVEGS
jgi:predicted nucleic acid-binding protein